LAVELPSLDEAVDEICIRKAESNPNKEGQCLILFLLKTPLSRLGSWPVDGYVNEHHATGRYPKAIKTDKNMMNVVKRIAAKEIDKPKIGKHP
jgi:hypothetical protein